MPENLKPENWVHNHSDYLYSYAMLRVFKKEDILDLIQETFYSAFKGKETFKGESSERTWLTSILKRKIVDYYRKKAKEREDPFHFSPFNHGHWLEEKKPKEWILEDNQIETKEFQVILQSCLSQLSPSGAAVFTLRSIEELNTEEICKELNISPSNLWTTLHRVKLQLRECMEKKWFGKRNRKQNG